ncbi:DUF2157 domain-containing protein [Neolewinella aurantiaca]|uniref:DUF2157 domain-containing protein n=1 Tax=Neolewinella aurantiaca TaxID=2602767 RepID=A0A5C7FXK4_9BACT|nr:DUF2157 domain-containing protein [Neolewinella aurantiaca]TXF89706.1 DUF2157 domain-containing protein [Neolewinella aurantiaca]
MTKITRLSIKLLARHSDLKPEELDEALDTHVYADAGRWFWLLRLLLPAIGIGFLACGILFFFAYNWSEIPKFGQLGIAAGAVIIPCVLSLIPSFTELIRKLLLTAAAFLVGPLFGVFGQIYQTGANAYDLFLAWCIFILVWVLAINFAPLWVLFLTLVNTTIVLYSEQVASGWSYTMLMFLLFIVNSVAVAGFVLADARMSGVDYPDWFKKTTALAAVAAGTVCCCSAVLDLDDKPAQVFYLVPVLALFAAVAWAAKRYKNLYHLTLLALACIAIVASIIIRAGFSTAAFLFAAIWVVGATTGSLIVLNNLRKVWRHD